MTNPFFHSLADKNYVVGGKGVTAGGAWRWDTDQVTYSNGAIMVEGKAPPGLVWNSGEPNDPQTHVCMHIYTTMKLNNMDCSYQYDQRYICEHKGI